MRTADVMTQEVIAVAPDATLADAIGLMVKHNISGLPVISAAGNLVGIMSEGDLLRRAELHTEKQRKRWIEFILGSERIANEYVHTHARTVADIMTPTVISVTEETPLHVAVRLMETHRVKRLPVMRGKLVVGIISRANLLHALAALQPDSCALDGDEAIRSRLVAELDQRLHARGQNNIVVRNGVVDLWGVVFSEAERDAMRVAAENTPGVKGVRDYLVRVDPFTGLLIERPYEIAARLSNAPAA